MSNFLALDIGERRVGVALASLAAKLPNPLMTLQYDTAIDSVLEIAKKENVSKIIVGLPLNHKGEPTKQTEFTEVFIERLSALTDIPIETCDESQSSKRAKAELIAKKKPFEKAEVDALAAAYILEDYLRETGGIQ